MTVDQHIDKLEKDIGEVKVQLNQLITLVQEMNKGLYGDEKNDHIGVIERQKVLDGEVQGLKKEILEIHKKNVEQDIALQARKSLKNDLVEMGKEVVKWVINGIVIYFIFKGVVDADALLK